METFPIVAAVVDEDYFETIVGRKPCSEDELLTFVHNIKKGVEWSIDWDEVNGNAKCAVEDMEV